MPEIVTLTVNPTTDIATSVERLMNMRGVRYTPMCYDPGGDGTNATRAVHRLGGDCLAIYLAGGPVAGRLARLLSVEGLSFAAPRAEEET